MLKRKLSFSIFLCLALVAFASTAIAADYGPGTNSTLEFVESFTANIGDKLLGFARGLFIGLATLSLALGLGKSILSGESNVGAIAAHFAKWMIYVGIFLWIMSSSGTATFLPKLIVNSFMEAGESISGQQVAPDDLLVAGIRLYGTMVERGWDAGWGDFIGIMLIGIVILVVVAMLAGTLAVALIEMHLVICGGAILLGFGGFEYTRDIAFSYLKYAVSIGVKLLMIMIVYALANALLIQWEANFTATADMAALISTAGQILGGTICIFMAARMVPSMAQSVVSGSALSFGHEMVTSTASNMTHAVAGEKTTGGQRVGGLPGVARTVVEALRTARTAQTTTFNGAANTIEAAKEGGIGGAVSYAAASTPGVRNVVNAAQTGGTRNAANYVAAGVAFGFDSERATRHLSNDVPEMAPGNLSPMGTSGNTGAAGNLGTAPVTVNSGGTTPGVSGISGVSSVSSVSGVSGVSGTSGLSGVPASTVTIAGTKAEKGKDRKEAAPIPVIPAPIGSTPKKTTRPNEKKPVDDNPSSVENLAARVLDKGRF